MSREGKKLGRQADTPSPHRVAGAAKKRGKKRKPGSRAWAASHDKEHCNATEMMFCQAYVAGGNKVACDAIGITPRLGVMWRKKPKIQMYIAELRALVDQELKTRGADAIASQLLMNDNLALDRTTEILRSPRDEKRGYADVIGGINANERRQGRKDAGIGPPTPFLSVRVENNNQTNILVDPAVERLQGQKVYRPMWVREQNGIADPADDAIDAHYLAIRAEREAAYAARASHGQQEVAAEDAGTMGSPSEPR